MDSILTSIKKQLGVAEAYEQFDPEIIIHINSAFSTLTQLGVGPSEGFVIKNKDDAWVDFLGTDETLEFIKEYIYLKVRMVFDPSASSTISKTFEERIKELEWRIHFHAETGGN